MPKQIKGDGRDDELVSAKIRRGTNQKARVLASLEGQSFADYMATTIDRAYEAAMHNRGRKVPVKQ